MIKLLIISVTQETLWNMVTDIITHVTPNIINGVVGLKDGTNNLD